VLEDLNRRKRKSTPACEQTVEDETSLWKPQENRGVFVLKGRSFSCAPPKLQRK
jgi:hypothetical protein